MAKAIGISKDTIIKVEANKVLLSLDKIKKLADVLNIKSDRLYLDDDYYNFLNYPASQKIKEIRLKLGLTQEEFAGLLKIHRKTVNRWEIGQSEVTKEKFRMLKKSEII